MQARSKFPYGILVHNMLPASILSVISDKSPVASRTLGRREPLRESGIVIKVTCSDIHTGVVMHFTNEPLARM